MNLFKDSSQLERVNAAYQEVTEEEGDLIVKIAEMQARVKYLQYHAKILDEIRRRCMREVIQDINVSAEPVGGLDSQEWDKMLSLDARAVNKLSTDYYYANYYNKETVKFDDRDIQIQTAKVILDFYQK